MKSPPGRFQGPYCEGWGSRCIKKLNRPVVGNTGDDAGLGLALEEEVKEPPACQPSQANYPGGLGSITEDGTWPWDLLLIHIEARLLAAKCRDGRPTGRGDIRGWRPLNKENLSKDIIIGRVRLLSCGSVADHTVLSLLCSIWIMIIETFLKAPQKQKPK